MPPLSRSRYTHTTGLTDAAGRLYLTRPEPYRYARFEDNRYHEVLAGDTWHGLAERHFPDWEDAANLWWVIADFQPEPVHDPTIELTPGQIVVIPSVRTLVQEILNPARADE